VQSAAGPNPSITITKIDTPVEGPSNSADGRRVPIRVGGSIEAGLLMVHPNPAYPAEARSRGVQGAVIISGVVSKDGQLQSLRVISSSNPLLETSVLETLQLWRYKPALLNREPVEMTTVITLNFTLGR
jgi:protein TonB